MAAKKSIAKGVGTPSRPPKAQAAVRSRRVSESRSFTKSTRSHGPAAPRAAAGANRAEKRGELLETLSARLSLVETAALALQKFEDDTDIGAICASLEHAIRMLANAHEQVEQYLLGSSG